MKNIAKKEKKKDFFNVRQKNWDYFAMSGPISNASKTRVLKVHGFTEEKISKF
jgi:hypothetical protein